MAENKKAAGSGGYTPNGNGQNAPSYVDLMINENGDLVNMSVSELRETAKTVIDELYSTLFPHEKLAVCAVISAMLNRCPAPVQDAETAARVRETLLNVAETDAHEHGLAEYCKQAAAAITVQGGAA